MRLAVADRLAQLYPPSALRQLVALAEEQKRRATSGRQVPHELPMKLVLDEQTGAVLEVEIPVRFGWA